MYWLDLTSTGARLATGFERWWVPSFCKEVTDFIPRLFDQFRSCCILYIVSHNHSPVFDPTLKAFARTVLGAGSRRASTWGKVESWKSQQLMDPRWSKLDRRWSQGGWAGRKPELQALHTPAAIGSYSPVDLHASWIILSHTTSYYRELHS